MSVETLEVLQAGLLTTVQDWGRYGYQRYGVPVSGAMDVFALRAANMIAGNDERAACLEMTVLGPKIRFLADTWIAVTGADLSPTLDGEPLPTWQAAGVSKDSVLAFSGATDGMRSYLAVAGGIDVPLVMGSRSTYLKAALGGMEGRQLNAGDVLSTLETEPGGEFAARGLPEHLVRPRYGHRHEIRVVLGPQDGAFTAEGIARFLGGGYTVSAQSDRMGYRLDGPLVEHLSGPDIVSDGAPLGAVQVPGDGRPIILLVDRGTTGGYAKVATVISCDIGRLAQAMPGDALTFEAVTVEEAHSALREEEEVLNAFRTGRAEPTPRSNFTIVVDGAAFEIAEESGEATPLPHGPEGGVTGPSHRVRATVDGEAYEFEVEVRREE